MHHIMYEKEVDSWGVVMRVNMTRGKGSCARVWSYGSYGSHVVSLVFKEQTHRVSPAKLKTSKLAIFDQTFSVIWIKYNQYGVHTN